MTYSSEFVKIDSMDSRRITEVAAMRVIALKVDADKNTTDSVIHEIIEDKSEEKDIDPEDFILCRQCRQIITHRLEQIAVNGSHQHTFANPHGYLFEIGCYASAPGCGQTGHPSSDFTWFQGYHWQIAVCRGCLTHTGWKFITTGNSFYGLIQDRLIEGKTGPEN